MIMHMNLKLIGLSNGDTIVAEFVRSQEDYLTIKNAIQLDPAGWDWCSGFYYPIEPDTEITLKAQAFDYMTNASMVHSKHYDSAVSKKKVYAKTKWHDPNDYLNIALSGNVT